MITIAIGINANGAAVFKNITARKTPSALEPASPMSIWLGEQLNHR